MQLEISLGEVAKGTNTIGADLAKQPADTDAEISWTKRIDISEYYSTVDFILCLHLRSMAKISLMQLMQQTQVNLQVRLLPQQRKQKLTREMQRRQSLILLLIRINSGYYVDVPVHLRTSKYSSTAENNTIYCKMSITDPKGTGVTDGDLYKAVRVAFIPADGSAASIWCVDDSNYETGKAVSSTTAKDSYCCRSCEVWRCSYFW